MSGAKHAPAQPELWPPNVATLDRLCVAYRWRKLKGDLLITCPYCGGKLALHESQPWRHCHGAADCASDFKSFDEIIDDLADRGGIS